MKTKKNYETNAIKVPKEVTAYEQAGKRARADFQELIKLGDSPAVKAYLEAKKKEEKPNEGEKRNNQILEISDSLSQKLLFVREQINILAIADGNQDEGIPNIGWTLSCLLDNIDAAKKLSDEWWRLHKGAKRAA